LSSVKEGQQQKDWRNQGVIMNDLEKLFLTDREATMHDTKQKEGFFSKMAG
jgi:hypothetical protein